MIKKSKGFTLIELLVVIAIIGILAGIVLVSLGGARASARDGRRQADLNSIKLAMELYYNDNNVYLQKTAAPTTELSSLNPVPKDPSTSADYGWVNNCTSVAGGCTAIGTATDSYCAYAVLEKASKTTGNTLYFVEDPKGPRQLDRTAVQGPPAATPCD